ncbi:MAG: DUF697 domain-containing protein [Desulfuromonadales bacterium]|jgi:uncharacterized protein (DUF697 family)
MAQTQEKQESEKAAVVEMTREERLAAANEKVKTRTLAAAGAGLVPIPIIDLVALTGVQLEMLKSLSSLYDVPFRKDLGKSLITTLVSGVVSVSMAPVLASLVKIIPLIGQTTGVLSMSVIGGASTYAVGKVFIQHFESGGTFLDFDPEKVRAYFAEQFDAGKKMAADTKPNK